MPLPAPLTETLLTLNPPSLTANHPSSMEDCFISPHNPDLHCLHDSPASPALIIDPSSQLLHQDDFWSDFIADNPAALDFNVEDAAAAGIFDIDDFSVDEYNNDCSDTAGSPSGSEDSGMLELARLSTDSSNEENSGDDAGERFEPSEFLSMLDIIVDFTEGDNDQEARELSESQTRAQARCGGSNKKRPFSSLDQGEQTHGIANSKKPTISCTSSAGENEGESFNANGPHSKASIVKDQKSTHPKSKGSQTHSGSKESKWAEQLLCACASAIASNNLIRTEHLMWVLNDLASFTGDANQRLAAYGLKALFSRVTGSISLPPISQFLNPNNSANKAPKPVQSALLRFQDASPWHQTVYTIANGAMLEACEGHEIVHIVDIGISQGTQWPTFIEALATRPSGPPKLMRLTIVQNFSVLFHGMGGASADFLSRLEPFAKKLGLKVELKTISEPLESLQKDDLNLNDGEALMICGQFRLHQINNEVDASSIDGGELPLSARDNFLQFIHSLNPNACILSENDTEQGSMDFLERFKKAIEFEWRFLDSMNVCFKGKDSEERQIIEGEAAMALINNVACEREARIERNEGHKRWCSRMRKAGFHSIVPIAEVVENAKTLLRKHEGNWDLCLEDNCMVLRWKTQPTTFCSIWKPNKV